jgi:hypothetical protein
MKRKPLNPSLPAPYNRMTAAEMDAEVKKFDHPMPGLPGSVLSRAQKARVRRASHKMGRPAVGKGAKRISITVEGSLLQRVDDYARRNRLTRSATIANGLRGLLKAG